MNNVGEKFLPLGTVVMLKGASKRLMITGFCTMAAEESEGVMYDYSGCLYPEGIISSDQTALFNHDQIEKIYHIGLVDKEETDFKVKLKQLLYSNNVVAESAPQAIREQEGVIPVVPSVSDTVEAPVPPIGPGLPSYIVPTPSVVPVQPVVTPVTSVQPVGPVVETPVAVTSMTPVQPVVTPVVPSGGFQFDANGNVIATPVATPQPEQPAAQPLTNIQFDENGTVISS